MEIKYQIGFRWGYEAITDSDKIEIRYQYQRWASFPQFDHIAGFFELIKLHDVIYEHSIKTGLLGLSCSADL